MNYLSRILKSVDWTRSMFLVPILLVAGISISHVVSWYDMTNPYNWAIYLSVSIEVGAMASLVAATKRIKGGVWFMFGIVTMIQIIGNIFYSYTQIDTTGKFFTDWVELTSPLFELMGTEGTNIVEHKRWLSLLTGGLLPLISLTALHFYIKYEKTGDEVVISEHKIEEPLMITEEPTQVIETKEPVIFNDIIDEPVDDVEYKSGDISLVEEENPEDEIHINIPKEDVIPVVETTPVIEEDKPITFNDTKKRWKVINGRLRQIKG